MTAGEQAKRLGFRASHVRDNAMLKLVAGGEVIPARSGVVDLESVGT